ncbi:hypothetical protein V8G54_037114, partial [Vigna mungo]
FLLDPAKWGVLSLPEKQRLVHEIAQQSKDASTMLQTFTRRELLEIICAELGKERKYTGYTKSQMIEHLLKIISKNSNLHDMEKAIIGCQRSKKNGYTVFANIPGSQNSCRNRNVQGTAKDCRNCSQITGE